MALSKFLRAKVKMSQETEDERRWRYVGGVRHIDDLFKVQAYDLERYLTALGVLKSDELVGELIWDGGGASLRAVGYTVVLGNGDQYRIRYDASCGETKVTCSNEVLHVLEWRQN